MKDSSSQPLRSAQSPILDAPLEPAFVEKIAAGLTLPSLPGVKLSPQEFVQTLFERAALNELKERSINELQKIVVSSWQSLVQFCTRTTPAPELRSPSAVIVSQSPHKHAVVLTLGDRPFIINTIKSCIREFGYSIDAFLHPMLASNGGTISLSYLEIVGLPEDRSEEILKIILSALTDLIQVTNDHGTMLDHVDQVAETIKKSAPENTDVRELSELLTWLLNTNYTFIASSTWSTTPRAAGSHLPPSVEASKKHGLLTSSSPHALSIVAEVRADAERLAATAWPFAITKLQQSSPVHRRDRLLNITVRVGNEFHSFLGLLTSQARATEAQKVPFVRAKLQKIIEAENVPAGAHDFRQIYDFIDTMPKEEALRHGVESLREMVRTFVFFRDHDEVASHIKLDRDERGATVLMVMRRDKLNFGIRRKLQAYVENCFDAPAGSSDYHPDTSNDSIVQFYYYIPLSEKCPEIDREQFAEDIATLARSWTESLTLALRSRHNAVLLAQALVAFPTNYQATYTPAEAVRDFDATNKLIGSVISVAVESTLLPTDFFTVTVYSDAADLTISRIFPVLDNAGLEVISERSASFCPRPLLEVYVHRFTVRTRTKTAVSTAVLQDIVGPGLEAVLNRKADDDQLNELLQKGVAAREIALLRAYCSLLWQVNRLASRSTIMRSVSSEPWAARAIIDMFATLFDPSTKKTLTVRREEFEKALIHFKSELRLITDLQRDRVVRSIACLLEHTVRTNYYLPTDIIALKLRSERIDIMPLPRPAFEIFMTGPTMEGVHLRGAPVARGGIRWSDRLDDYRTEVLGLMKTQRIKNALIVPNGAKGGFVVKTDRRETSPITAEQGRETYKMYIRTLLSITDNRRGDLVVHPEHIIAHDGRDPYFVVAADKGTATFSDTANAIAVDEFKFWLADAFASGGSNGYDHKIYGVTARGGWESVKRHCNDLGISIETQGLTVVGIGDMAGDVFGNGLLMSNQLRLVAAFNHKHIFIDPSPHPAKSFAERKRLFALKGSQWSDYAAPLISRGGGIFGRFDKEIRLSVEARNALGIGAHVTDAISGEELMTHILKAPVDLLWNGGIGTYVKAGSESHADAGDSTNDLVRINATELRCKMVAEGGNLGFTQKARVEFAKMGGRINTDAVDNSGGVDLSDHEVNLKILLSAPSADGSLPLEKRNAVLKEIGPEVLHSVLKHNRNHALVLTLAQERSRSNGMYFLALIRELARLGYVNRQLDRLPDDEELNKRIEENSALTRPEVAICLSAVKMWIKDEILASEIPDENLAIAYLVGYFPPVIRERFSGYILKHPLARNIIATEIANDLVDTMGVTFVHRMCVNHAVTPRVVIGCAVAAASILGSIELRESLIKYDTATANREFIVAVRDLSRAVLDLTSWLIRYHAAGSSLSDMVASYRDTYRSFQSDAGSLLRGKNLSSFQEKHDLLRQAGITTELATALAFAQLVPSVMEILWTAKETGSSTVTAALVSQTVAGELFATELITRGLQVDSTGKWQQDLLVYALDEIRRGVSSVSAQLISKGVISDEAVIQTIQSASGYQRLYQAANEVAEKNPDVAAFAVIGRQIRTFSV